MPKLKTHKGTAKRVKRTSTGKILRGSAGTHHFQMQQTKRGKRAKKTDSAISGGIAKNIKRAIGA
ncbi:MAG: 50S ribosomal protein L35 [Candidatus Nomurabacteria bacterium]|jgi:large subunit ribosomal protein L35|nr:50S ribosomal protein L35 [Candidatus Nomurabacteria bacterium]